jgi:hypothetical protein
VEQYSREYNTKPIKLLNDKIRWNKYLRLETKVRTYKSVVKTNSYVFCGDASGNV